MLHPCDINELRISNYGYVSVQFTLKIKVPNNIKLNLKLIDSETFNVFIE